jgi:hypothetical protein
MERAMGAAWQLLLTGYTVKVCEKDPGPDHLGGKQIFYWKEGEGRCDANV